MEINVGDYIRTNDGVIGKVNVKSDFYRRFRSKLEDDVYYIDNKTDFMIKENEIVKHSKNIIDLIEVGDYVNGYKVSDKESTLLCTNVKGIDRSGYHIPISQYGDGIKSIVTKEMFESMEYKVGEE